jgi:phosphotriesterase-related protein
MALIPTARGDVVDTAEMGFTLITECVVGPRMFEKEMNWSDHTWCERPVEERIASTVRQLEEAKAHGVDTISDRVIPGIGRDVRTLKRVAEQTTVNIIVPTGWYTWRDVPMFTVLRDEFPQLVPDDEPTLEDLFVRDIEEGVLDTGVRAGTIKIVTDRPGITEGVAKVMGAAARAHRRTGTPIVTHTGIGIGVKSGLLQQEFLKKQGVDLSRVNIGHVDWTDPDTPLDDFERLLMEGSFLSFDTVHLDVQWAPEFRARLRAKRIERIVRLIGQGYGSQLMLSHDDSTYQDVQPMPAREFPTYCEVSLSIIPQLKENGVTDEQVHEMTVRNPARFFETTTRGGY